MGGGGGRELFEMDAHLAVVALGLGYTKVTTCLLVCFFGGGCEVGRAGGEGLALVSGRGLPPLPLELLALLLASTAPLLTVPMPMPRPPLPLVAG